MKPLEKSHAADDLEDDLRNLFIQVYKQELKATADEINVYGAPHIGPFALVAREVAKDGLSVLRTTDEDALRYLVKAWRFRNPRRGLHFLRLYLRVLFGEAHDVNQMWQRKDAPYPTSLAMSRDIVGTTAERDYFLTSRVQVDIDSEFLTTTLKEAFLTTVPAKIFLDVRSAKYGRSGMGFAAIGAGMLTLRASNYQMPEPYEPPPIMIPDDFGTAQGMMAGLFSFIRRSTGRSARYAGMPELTTDEGLVKNNQFVGGALGGYTADGVTSSEGISLLMRGLAHAYLVDKDPAKLRYLKFLMNAACKYYFFDARPTANRNTKWYHTWMVNAGPEFNVRGPLAANGQLDQGGYIGAPVTFNNGIGYLNPAPDIVYQAVTPGTEFVWDNVFSEIMPGTGERVDVEYYIDKSGNRIYGVQKGGSFGQPSEQNSGEIPGKIVLSSSLTGSYLVNYCVSVPDVSIAYGESYEAWPMWRKLADGERSMAADALHWFADAFRLMMLAEPENPEWGYAHARTLDVWTECCEQESNTTKIFTAGKSGPYNNFPLTYSFAYGVDNVDDGLTRWDTKPPTSYYSALRTEDGYVTFTLPEDHADLGTGGRTRYGTVFENKPLYLNYTPESSFVIDTRSTLDAVLTMTIRSDQGDAYHAAVMVSPASRNVSLGISQFMRFEKPGTGSAPVSEIPCWKAGDAIYAFNADIVGAPGERVMANGKSLAVSTFTIPDDASGFGFTKEMVTPNLSLTIPPRVCYASTAVFTLTLRDSYDWLWVVSCPVQPMLTERTWSWSSFTLSPYQDADKAGVPLPSAPTGIIKAYQFNGASSISVAYIAGGTPFFAQQAVVSDTSDVVEVARWIPGERIFDFNTGVAREVGYRQTAAGKSLICTSFRVPDAESGLGITYDMVTPFLELTAPPIICYASTSDFSLSLKDGNDWLWVAPMPKQDTLAERTWTWSAFTLSAYQEASKTGQTPPSAPTGIIKVYQFTGAPGVHGAAGIIAQTLSIAYLSSVSPKVATSGTIRTVRLLNPVSFAHTWKVGDVALVNGSRRNIAYYGTLPFGLMIGGPSRSRLAVIPFRGPYIAGYQSGTPWVDLGDETKLGAMLDFMGQAQIQFTMRSPTGIVGPFMHSYLPATWDSEQYGTLDTWVWDGPDGNPAWNGWQYRAFDAMAHTWNLMVEKGMSQAVRAKAQAVCSKFLAWLYGWLEANPKVHYIPSNWGPEGWSQGIPLPPSSYLDPHGHNLEAHDLALVLKGAIYCARAGGDLVMCRAVIARALAGLALGQVRSRVDPMRGSFSLNPQSFECYSFHQGEIMDALALAMRNEDLLPEAAKSVRNVSAGLLEPDRQRLVGPGLVRVTALSDIRAIAKPKREDED